MFVLKVPNGPVGISTKRLSLISK